MNDIEEKALALWNEVRAERAYFRISEINRTWEVQEALCRAIEQHEAFRQEVSDTMAKAIKHIKDGRPAFAAGAIGAFVIPKPKPKPDPLVAALEGVTFDHYPPNDAETIRAALDALGFEIREKNDG